MPLPTPATTQKERTPLTSPGTKHFLFLNEDRVLLTGPSAHPLLVSLLRMMMIAVQSETLPEVEPTTTFRTGETLRGTSSFWAPTLSVVDRGPVPSSKKRPALPAAKTKRPYPMRYFTARMSLHAAHQSRNLEIDREKTRRWKTDGKTLTS